MSKKKTLIDKAIETCRHDIAVLELTIEKLQQQQKAAPVRRKKATSAPPANQDR